MGSITSLNDCCGCTKSPDPRSDTKDNYHYDYDEKVNVPQKSKIALHSAELIASIITNYFKCSDNKCEYMTDKSMDDMITSCS